MLSNCFYDCGFCFKDEYEKCFDVFGIDERIKKINPFYELLFNRITKQFEIHNTVQPVSSLVCVCPFDNVDERLVELLFKTRRENFDKIFTQIENDNFAKQTKNIEKMKNFAENYTKEALTLAEKKGGSLSKTDFLDIEKSLKEN